VVRTIALLLLIPGVAWLVGREHKSHLRAESRVLVVRPPDVFELTVYAARYGGHDSYTIALADGELRRSCTGVCDY
jgi:hypothetical protein